MEVPITNDELEGTLRFIRTVDKESVARFIINQDRAIEGLTANNRELAKAYRESLKSTVQKTIAPGAYNTNKGKRENLCHTCKVREFRENFECIDKNHVIEIKNGAVIRCDNYKKN